MPRQSLIRASNLSSAEAAEAAFYEALNHADLDALMQVWGDDDELVCIHPGGQRLLGVRAIRASFEQMLAQGPLAIAPERVQRQVSSGCAVHNLIERVQLQGDDGERIVAYVACTNVYLKTPDGWRLVLHHASPGLTRDVEELLSAGEQQLH